MLYPLKFHPHLRFYPFGGYKIGRVFAKEDIPTDRTVAESWEISASPGAESVVKNGILAGLTLQEVLDKFGPDLVGESVWSRYGNYFPILIKFLDAARDLPPQVHPDDEYAARVGLPYRGKTEAWYILQADAGAQVWCGSKPGLTREEFQTMIRRGDTFAPMKRLATRAGETYFVPAGRLHALGSGNFIVEVQQNSDAVFAWDWLDWPVDARQRQKDIEHSLEVAVIEQGDPEKIAPVVIARNRNLQEYLVACRYFILEKLVIRETWEESGDTARFVALIPISGAGVLIYGDEGYGETIRAGESLLLPAKIGVWSIKPEGELQLIRATVPKLLRQDLIEPLRLRGIDGAAISALGGYGRSNDLEGFIKTWGSEV